MHGGRVYSFPGTTKMGVMHPTGMCSQVYLSVHKPHKQASAPAPSRDMILEDFMTPEDPQKTLLTTGGHH